MVKRVVICNKCNESKIHYARELCRKCYRLEPNIMEKENKYYQKYRENNKEILRLKEEKRRKLNRSEQ